MKVLQASWEIEEAERYLDFFRSLQHEQEERFKVAEVELDLFKQLMCERGLSALDEDRDFFHVVFAEELNAFEAAEEQCRQLEQRKPLNIGNNSDTEANPDEDDSCSVSSSNDSLY